MERRREGEFYHRPGTRARLALAAAGALILHAVLACTPPSQRNSEPEPWQRIDLCFQRPTYVDEQGRLSAYKARCSVQHRGPADVRDLGRLSRWQRDSVPAVPAGQVRAIEQAVGSVLQSRVELGAEPYFSFAPLSNDRCDLRYRIAAARPGEEPQELLSLDVEGGPPANRGGAVLVTGPVATTVVNLDSLGPGLADLQLRVEGPEGCAGRWGSPAVFSRYSSLGEARQGEEQSTAQPRKDRSPPVNVLLVGADTLRADALGAWGHEPSVTPALDHLAAQAEVYEQAFSTFNVTSPSFASILTGHYGLGHGLYDNSSRLGDALPTLAELFAAAGYATGAILASGHLEAAGLGRGFAELAHPTQHYRGETVVDQAMGWIAAQDRPFFLWLHLFDPHTPHVPPRPFSLGQGAARPFGLSPMSGLKPFRDQVPVAYEQPFLGGHRDLYVAEVAYLDRQMDRLLGFMESQGLLETTVVAFVADHGENLAEREDGQSEALAYTHLGLWDTTTHVPLILRLPGQGAVRRIDGLVQTLDLFPTLLRLAGLVPPASDGRDLHELASQGGRRVVFAEHASRRGEMVRTRRSKLIVSRDNPRIAAGQYLYDLQADPGEGRNIAGQGSPEEQRLGQLLELFRDRSATTPVAPTLQLDEEAAARLRALGYGG